MSTATGPEVRKTAVISPCGRFRYSLGRHWGDGLRVVNFLMVNPSTADAEVDDPTIVRCIGFARAWKYDGLIVTNLYAIRATDVRKVWEAPDRVGPENDRHIRIAAEGSSLVVCAWGAKKKADHRIRSVLSILRDLNVVPHMIRRTASGYPEHPLMLPNGLDPIPYR